MSSWRQNRARREDYGGPVGAWGGGMGVCHEVVVSRAGLAKVGTLFGKKVARPIPTGST